MKLKDISFSKLLLLSVVIHISIVFVSIFPTQDIPTEKINSLLLNITQNFLNQVSLPQKIKSQKVKTQSTSMEEKISQIEEISKQNEEHLSQKNETSRELVIDLYGTKIIRLINENKKYPRMARSLGQQGKVIVNLKLDKLGHILELKVVEKPIYQSLVDASLESIKSVDHFPPIPDELGLNEISFLVPIDFIIKL